MIANFKLKKMRTPKLPWIPTINFVAVWNFIKRFILRRRTVQPQFFGLKRDKPDDRDIMYKVHLPGLAPETTDMHNVKEFSLRYDQGSLGSCTANAALYAFRRVLQVNSQPDWDGSRLFTYYNARSDDSKGEDSGASIRDVIKGLAKYGVCREKTWPYIVNKFATEPDQAAFFEALDHQAIKYERLPQTREAIMDAIYRGFPVVYGKILYESFMSEEVARTGVVPNPRTCMESQIGGHAMMIIDYEKDYVIEVNSWGESWGQRGICKVPWKYILNSKLAFDFWVIYITE